MQADLFLVLFLFSAVAMSSVFERVTSVDSITCQEWRRLTLAMSGILGREGKPLSICRITTSEGQHSELGAKVCESTDICEESCMQSMSLSQVVR